MGKVIHIHLPKKATKDTLQGGSSKAAFSHNVKTEVKAGKPVKQAVAIAYSKQRETNDAPDDTSKGHWITINGTHVKVSEGGKITAGPKELKAAIEHHKGKRTESLAKHKEAAAIKNVAGMQASAHYSSASSHHLAAHSLLGAVPSGHKEHNFAASAERAAKAAAEHEKMGSELLTRAKQESEQETTRLAEREKKIAAAKAKQGNKPIQGKTDYVSNYTQAVKRNEAAQAAIRGQKLQPNDPRKLVAENLAQAATHHGKASRANAQGNAQLAERHRQEAANYEKFAQEFEEKAGKPNARS